MILVAAIFLLTGCTIRIPVQYDDPDDPRSPAASISGFRPIEPALYTTLEEKWLTWPQVSSVTPTLRWESVPGTHQLPLKGQGQVPRKPFIDVDLSRLSDITYELRIWRVLDFYPQDIVYERTALPDPFHKVEVPLETGSLYYWSVRARFKLDSSLTGRPESRNGASATIHLAWPGAGTVRSSGRWATPPTRRATTPVARDRYPGIISIAL